MTSLTYDFVEQNNSVQSLNAMQEDGKLNPCYVAIWYVISDLVVLRASLHS